MIHHIETRSADEAFEKGIRFFEDWQNRRLVETRNGPALRAMGVVVTEAIYPWRRVCFNKTRDANPFFHFMEAMWILAGRDDVATVAEFNSKIVKYSDNGKTFAGAYGMRLFEHLPFLIDELSEYPNSRRAVVNLYDAEIDLGACTKDIPCNIAVKAEIANGGVLDLYVFNRSNDMIWGAYGANIVHFSFLLEYLASKLGVPMGKLITISTDFHVYCDVFKKHCDRFVEDRREYPQPFFLDATPKFDRDLQTFMNEGSCQTEFFRGIAEPMRRAWRERKAKKWKKMELSLQSIVATDWRMACCEWVERRSKNVDVQVSS